MNLKMAKILLQLGINPDTLNSEGKDPIDVIQALECPINYKQEFTQELSDALLYMGESHSNNIIETSLPIIGEGDENVED